MVSQAAYGFRIEGEGVSVPGALAVSDADGWPLARVSTTGLSGRTEPLGIRLESALIGMPQGVIAVDRRDQSAVIETAEPLEPEDVVHPYLWPIGTVLARWLGWETFHAGAVVVDGGAWGLLGESGDGKSTMLAWLALRAKLPILTDDLLVTHGGHAYAGPRSLDLLPSAASRLGIAGRLVRSTSRRRLMLPAAQGQVPLRGWVFLDWGAEVAVEGVPHAERLSRLSSFRRASEMGADGAEWLGLISLPMVVLRRSRRWDQMDEAGERLIEELQLRALSPSTLTG